MNNKQLGRKFTTENINAKAARQAIAMIEGFPTKKLVNASDAEVVELFEALTRNMKDEVVSEMVENYEEALEAEKAQDILNSYLKGDLTPAIDFTLVENKALSSYEVMHNIEGLENVSFIFPATKEYKEIKEKYHNFRCGKTWHDLMEMQECELEELYVYDSPSQICYNGTCYIVHEGMIIKR